MLRTITAADRSVVPDFTPPVTVPANTATDGLIDRTKMVGEWVRRQVFNAGPNDTYYLVGGTCSAVLYNGVLAVGQLLDNSDNLLNVSFFSPSGTTLTVTELRRADMSQRPNIVNQ